VISWDMRKFGLRHTCCRSIGSIRSRLEGGSSGSEEVKFLGGCETTLQRP